MDIIIRGSRGEGKTSLAITICRLLKAAGYSPEYIGDNQAHTRQIIDQINNYQIKRYLHSDAIINILDGE